MINLVDALLDPTTSEMIDLLGPVWCIDPKTRTFLLPERTLGWDAISWIMENVTNGEVGDASGPFVPTPEQARFLLWFYALNEDGTFQYNEGVLQRLKGWGKDPLVCVMSLFEALGPCRFAGWADEEKTIPISTPQPLPLVQILAVTQDQTDSTLRLYRHYLSKEKVKALKIEINTEAVKVDGVQVIQAVTANPSALEGKSSTFVIANESHQHTSDISKAMWKVVTRNSVKVKGGASRILAITNAYDPNEGSVAQDTREAYEAQVSVMGTSKILYDSIEIKSDVELFVYDTMPDGSQGPLNVEKSKERIGFLVDISRGDSKWSSLERIVDEFFDTRYPIDLQRRFWLNTVVTSSASWIDVRDLDKCFTADIRVSKADKITLFFDGSKTDDSTVLMGCRISDGYIFKIAAWHKPTKGSGLAGTKWLVPRTDRDKAKFDVPGFPNPYRDIETVDDAVKRSFRDYNVVAFFADPSHAREDVDNKLYWDSIIEDWHVRYSKQLIVWAGSKTGSKAESIMWDMQDSKKIEEFAEFAERVSEMVLNHELIIQQDSDIRTHFKNAKVYKTKSGLESIWKGKKNSDKKIDLAVGAIGAYMLRSRYLKQVGEQKKRTGSFNKYL